MAAILIIFSDLLSCPYRKSYRLHNAYTYTYLILTYIDKRNNATEIYFLKFMSIFSLIIICALTYGPLKLSCVFLANYVPKWQMNLHSCGPILTFSHFCHKSKRCRYLQCCLLEYPRILMGNDCTKSSYYY